MVGFDANCFSGNWPFFYVRENSVKKLQQQHNEYGIDGGFLSSLEAIFYQDPYEAEVQLAEQIRGTNYHHAMIVNPTLPAWEADLIRCVENLHIRGIRLLPAYHGYTLQDDILDRVIALTEKYNLQLILTLRMHDDRTSWMLTPASIPMEDVKAFSNRCGSIKLLITHIRTHEIAKLQNLGVCWQNIYVDTSGFKDGNNPIQNAIDADYLNGHILYGSGAPLLEMYATILQLTYADCDKQLRDRIFTGEALLNIG